MSEILTSEEIESRHEGEWVLIKNPKLDKDLNVIRGEGLPRQGPG